MVDTLGKLALWLQETSPEHRATTVILLPQNLEYDIATVFEVFHWSRPSQYIPSLKSSFVY